MSTSPSVRRRFQPVKLEVLGHEDGRDRFERDGYFDPPSISGWRNNLTALSQHFNLYFVASVDKIHVYVPEFLNQSLGHRPRLILDPPLANPEAQGYLDPGNPHAINHIVVGDLGRDEVLVLATDSGNVAAYHTGPIARAIERQSTSSIPGPWDDAGLRPFFSHWVFESAWGIAIHTAARLIAISANVPHHVHSVEATAKITVFAFALHSDASYGTDSEDSDSTDSSSAYNENQDWLLLEDIEILHRQLSSRTRNLKIVLSEHRANIPNIAFVNNHHDPYGKWLFATDIDGEMKLWRIWDREVCRSYDFSENRYGSRALHQEEERGWSVIPLDPASFRTTSGFEEFCGCADPSEYYPSSGGEFTGGLRESYRISGIAGVSRNVFGQTECSDEEDEALSDLSEDGDMGGVSLVTEEHNTWVNGFQAESSDQEVGEQGIHLSDQVRRQNVHFPDPRNHWHTLVSQPTTAEESREFLQALLSREHQRPSNFAALLRAHQGDSTMTMTEPSEGMFDQDELDVDTDTFAVENSSPHQLLSPQSQPDSFLSSSRAWTPSYLGLVEMPPLPVLHLSTSNIRLINTPRASQPHFLLSDPAGGQYFPPALSWMYRMDRLSMTACLPELGVVIAASQTGRVVLLTLTKRAESGCLGCRVDWVLPLDEQEQSNQRPGRPLLGMAVAPIQGQYKSSEDLDIAKAHSDITSKLGMERTIDGVLCTFDNNFLDLSAVNNHRTSLSEDLSDRDIAQYRSSVSRGRRGPGTPPRRTTLSPKSRKQLLPTPPRTLTSSGSFSPRVTRTQSETAQKSSSSSSSSRYRPRDLPAVTAPWTAPASDVSHSHSSQGGSKRYRLLLTYYDQTVLSYEIQRVGERVGIWGSGKRNMGNREEEFVI